MGGNTSSMFPKETPRDVFWFRSFHMCVLEIVTQMEIDAYNYMSKQGLSSHLSSTKHKLIADY